MTAKAKVVNYTADQTASIVAAYTAAPTRATVTELAAKFQKTERSVIAKLSKEGVYVKAERTTKNGKPIEKKGSLADKIGQAIGLTEGDTTSLEKVNKTALAAILNAIQFAATKAGEMVEDADVEVETA
jgi:hypothetical protein